MRKRYVDGNSNKTKYLTFYGRKVESTRNCNFGDYPGDIRLYSGDREIRSKIWSLPDYPGELTAQMILTLFKFSRNFRVHKLKLCGV